VIIAGRDAAKARAAASELAAQLPAGVSIEGADSLDAVRRATVAVLSVPYAAQSETALALRDVLAGKVLVDVTAPLVPPKVSHVQLPPEGSVVARLQRQLGPEVRVVSAFQNVSAQHLRDLAHDVDCDVLVCGDDAAAVAVALELVSAAGLRGWHAGPLANSIVAEGLTSVLIAINQRYKIAGAGLRITGTPKAP
jgi:NADPH-dependent F420 reductase